MVAIDKFCSQRHSLQCVLLDLQMPIMDGWRTAQEMRAIEAAFQWPRIPIVACTALGLQDTWHEHHTVANSALQCGVDELMVRSAVVVP